LEKQVPFPCADANRPRSALRLKSRSSYLGAANSANSTCVDLPCAFANGVGRCSGVASACHRRSRRRRVSSEISKGIVALVTIPGDDALHTSFHDFQGPDARRRRGSRGSGLRHEGYVTWLANGLTPRNAKGGAFQAAPYRRRSTQTQAVRRPAGPLLYLHFVGPFGGAKNTARYHGHSSPWSLPGRT